MNKNEVSPWRDVTLQARRMLPLVSYVGVLQTPTDDDDRRRQTHGEQNNTGPPILCVGGPVITVSQNGAKYFKR